MPENPTVKGFSGIGADNHFDAAERGYLGNRHVLAGYVLPFFLVSGFVLPQLKMEILGRLG